MESVGGIDFSLTAADVEHVSSYIKRQDSLTDSETQSGQLKRSFVPHDCEAKVAALTQGILGRKRVADPCSSNPCQRGTCTSSNGDFECHCPSGYSGKTCDMGPLPMDCKDIINRPNLFSNRGDGVYTIMLPRSRTLLQVFCDMTYDSGGWTVSLIVDIKVYVMDSLDIKR
ncbi:CRUM2-like protein [Mya arenaria]|uniref:CRUM2-like protein n=1 Tax=Mya arenaria TaxID=6604 RepID=A0ABY7EEF3_MYAAR|nr:CRUM2-like protein [Mya arenaria]